MNSSDVIGRIRPIRIGLISRVDKPCCSFVQESRPATVLRFVTLVLLLAGCSASTSPELRLGTNIWPGYEPLYLAKELGYYPQGTVDLVEYLSASEVIRAFRNHSIEAAALTLDEALLLLDHQLPVQLVLVTDISAGGDVILARPGIADVTQLEGKSVGVEGGALGAYILSRALDIHGLGLDAVKVVQLDVSEQETAYLNQTVDAIVTFDPVRSKVLSVGAQEIFSSREIPGEIVDVIVVHETYLSEHPEQLKTLVEGWFRALNYLDEHPHDAADRMRGRLGLSSAQVLASYRGMKLPTREENRNMLGGETPQLRATVERLQDIMLQNGLIKHPVAVDFLLAPAALSVAGQ